MIILNLLAEEAKKSIKQRRLYLLFLRAELVLLIFIFAGGIIFFTADKLLSSNFLKFGLETSVEIKSSSNDYNAQVKKINEKLLLVTNIQNGFISYSPLLKKIAALTPSGISFSYLKIDTASKTIKIRGHANLQENLLALEKNFKEAPWLTKISIPLADKIGDNVDFDIELGFDLTKID